jgi:flagellar basal body L-ring protein FlgH
LFGDIHDRLSVYLTLVLENDAAADAAAATGSARDGQGSTSSATNSSGMAATYLDDDGNSEEHDDNDQTAHLSHHQSTSLSKPNR